MKVTLNPIAEIKITHVHKTTVEQLTKIEAVTDSPKLYWCNGLLFSCYEFGTDKLQCALSNGIWFIETFSYAVCEKKIEVSKWNGYAIEIVDYSNHSTFEELTKEIKEMKN